MITTQFRTRYILTLRLICICVYLVCLRPEQLFCEKRKQHASPGDNVSTAKAASGRVGRGEQGEARRTNSTPNGEPRFELARLRLKTWCKNDLSIAHTTPHSSYMYLYVHPHSLVQRATFCIAPTSRCSMAQSQAETLHNQLLFDSGHYINCRYLCMCQDYSNITRIHHLDFVCFSDKEQAAVICTEHTIIAVSL